MTPGTLVDGAVPSRRIAGLCALAMRTVTIDGAAAVLVGRSGHRSLLGSVGELSADLEELSTVLGEGPVVDATAHGSPVVVDQLDRDGYWFRWPVFTGEALRLGIAAVLALPLQIGAISLGVFVAYRIEPGPISADDLMRLFRIADTAAYLVLDLGRSADAAQDEIEVSAGVSEAGSLKFIGMEIHQASGMVMVQLGVSIESALARLRAYAFTHERPLAEVAHDVLARTLELGDDDNDTMADGEQR